MTNSVSGGGPTTGPVTTVCNACVNIASHGSTADSSAKETEGAQVHDVIEVMTDEESLVGAKRAQTVACRSDGVMAPRGI
jgi:hypothetical protein